jgi:hypothetical protein
MKTISIKICTVIEGEYAREVLTENGIRVVLVPHQESDAVLIGDFGMVEVLVNDADAKRAVQILDEALAQDDPLSTD